MDFLSRKVPYAYEQLEYIESSGTQYIDTGINYFADFEVDIKLSQNVSNKSLGTDGSYCLQRLSGANPYWNFTSGGAYFSTIPILERHKVKWKDNKVYSDDVYLADKEKSTTVVSGRTFSLFGVNNQPFSNIQIYHFKAWDTDGVLIRDMIPVQRKSDSVYGMYDTVNGVFYQNAGTGTFTAGPVIKTVDAVTIGNKDVKQLSTNNKVFWNKYTVPSIYTQKNYIESSGTQYINTGVAYDVNKTLINKVKLYYTTTPSGNYSLNGWDAGGAFGIDSSNRLFDGSNSGSVILNKTAEIKQTINAGSNTQTLLECTVDGSTETLSRNHTSIASYATLGYALFGCVSSGRINYYSSERIYYLKMYQDGTLVRDFVPVVRNSDSVAGMYDKVTDTFYTNAGTGTFITD